MGKGENKDHHKQQNIPKTYKKQNVQECCEKWYKIKLELLYSQCSRTQQRRRGKREERGREIPLTFLHTCHRTRIPVGHVLIEI